MIRTTLIVTLALGAASGLAAQQRNAGTRPPTPSREALSPPGGVTIQATPVLVEMMWQPVPGAVPTAGEAAATIVPWVTPSLEAPVIAAWRQERADLVIYWTPSPGAVKYVVTASGLPPMDVAPQNTTLRLPNLSPGRNQGASVTVAVHAWFGPSIVALGPGTTIVLAPVNSCWPLAQLPPGPGPGIAGLHVGVTSIGIIGTPPPNSGAAILYERAVSGSPVWETLGCNAGGTEVYDINLQPGTAYDYRITSSFGLSKLVPQSENSLYAVNVPAGAHVFTLTVLYPVMRPSPMPPSHLTVVVPVPSAN